MSNSKNIAVNINGYDVHPTGRYDLSFVLKVLNCSRPNISYLIKNGRLDPPIYPYGRTTNRGGKPNTRDPHYWFGSAIIKAFCGENWQQEQGAESEDR